MSARRIYQCVLVLAAIWSIAIGVIYVIHSSRPTPQSFIAYVTEHPLQKLNAAERQVIIKRVARKLNGLNLEQRQELKASGALRNFFAQLTTEERRWFMAATLPEASRQLIETLNQMEPAQRKRLAQRTLRKLREGSVRIKDLGSEDEITGVISQGLALFNARAHPQVRQDFAAVIEELKRTQELSQSDNSQSK
jgi:hypothetical protein